MVSPANMYKGKCKLFRPRRETAGIEPAEAQIDAALKAAYPNWQMPSGAASSDYHTLAELRAADREADRLNREAMPDIPRAALNA